MGDADISRLSKHHSVVLASNMSIKATYIFAFLALMVHLSVTVHVESGILECGNAVDWWDGEVEFDGHTYDYSKHITVNFDQTYESPPTVFLSEVSRNINTGNRRDIYGVGVLEVTTTGFTMACGSYGVESWHIFYSTLSWLTVSWLSVS